MKFTKATKTNLYARLALIGASGGGKTYTGLRIAQHLAQGKRVAVLDTERGSASKYSDEFDFDVVALESFAPSLFRDAIKAAVDGDYGCILIDSLSHAWMGKDGVLEFKDEVARRGGKNSYTAWREAGEEQNKLVDAMLAAPIHVIVTMRSKMEYIQEQDERTGKTVVRKVGLQPVQRDGLEYEFDIVADMIEGRLVVGKTRCRALDKRSFMHAGEDFAGEYLAWLTGGTAPAPQPAPSGDSDTDALIAEFLQICEKTGSDPKTTANRILANYPGNPKKLQSLMVSQLRHEVAALRQEFGALCE